MKTVPFFRPSIGDEEIQAVTECLKSGWLTTGPKTTQFEDAFSAFLGGDVYSLAVNSATAALHLGLEALGVGPGDEVIVPTFTFTATAEVIRYLGAKPVFVDVEMDTFCMSALVAEESITPNTKVIMPVHFAGRMCNMTKLCALAKRYNLKILDDAAHALPAHHQGRSVGNCGTNATAFSFYANKTITTGEGGMLVTNNLDIANRVRKMRLHGIDRDVFNRFTDPRASWIYDVVAPGYKYNITDIASALGIVQLSKVTQFQRKRNSLVDNYNKAFAGLPVILPPKPLAGDKHSWHLYILQLSDESLISRDRFIELLKESGIGISVHYRPLHKMTVWKPFCYNSSYPIADKISDRCVSLPLFMDMTDEEQNRVIEVVQNIFKNRYEKKNQK